jgi:hypothetical protein
MTGLSITGHDWFYDQSMTANNRSLSGSVRSEQNVENFMTGHSHGPSKKGKKTGPDLTSKH